VESRFDQALGPASASLSRLRKLNLQLSGSYRTVALMPKSDAPEGRSPKAQSAARAVSAELSLTGRPGVKLHLCR
jgi:hypothetical protein